MQESQHIELIQVVIKSTQRNDITDILPDNIWTIILGYLNNISPREKTDKSHRFTWTNDQDLMKLVILAPNIANLVFQQNELPGQLKGCCKKTYPSRKHTLSHVAQAYGMKQYIDWNVKSYYSQLRRRGGPLISEWDQYYDKKTRENELKLTKKYLPISLIALAIALCILILKPLDNTPLQPIGDLCGAIFILVSLYSLTLAISQPIDNFYLSPADLEDFIGEKKFCELINMNMGPLLADYLNTSEEEIKLYTINEILSKTDLKYKSALKKHKKTNPSHDEDQTPEILNETIQFAKKRLNFFTPDSKNDGQIFLPGNIDVVPSAMNP